MIPRKLILLSAARSLAPALSRARGGALHWTPLANLGRACGIVALALACVAMPSHGQGVPKFEIERSPIQLEGHPRLGVYLGGVGREAAFFGSETGELEAWAWPVKLIHDFRLAFKIPDYTEPIPGERVAKRVIVRPELMTVVYSHATFTVTQHFLVPLHEPGIIVLLDVSTVRPLEIEASFQADLNLMWPAGIGGQYALWWGERNRFLLSESRREYNAYVGSPFATGGSSHPAHAAPDAPSVFKIAVDTGRIASEFIPIVIAGGIMPRDSLDRLYDRLLANSESYYGERIEHASRLRAEHASVETPDSIIDLALEWAKVNLDEALACNPDLGCGLVAGYGPSGRGRRPGFGWFFGGDASINTLGILPYGGFEIARPALEFQRRYQRADGKMPHEITQSALRTREDWFTAFPYGYYHADTTPYWIVALHQYWLQSADTAFVRANRDGLLEAYRWVREHDSDGDRIVDNTAGGLGAIEVGGLSAGMHQDIYLAAVSVESLRATADLAAALGDGDLAAEASAAFDEAARNFEREYYMADVGRYAFGVLEGGRTNPAVTAWPAVAGSFHLLDLRHAEETIATLASSQLLTDWGVRLLSSEHEYYDPLHYNNGAVWPFMTGFTSWALYNYGFPDAGFAALRANAENTFFDALGRNPELMSGAYHRTLDTTVPHQFFATSMIPTPLFRGLLGLEADAPRGRLEFAPQLPQDWDSTSVLRYPVGTSRIDIRLTRGEEVHGAGCEIVSAQAITARFERTGNRDPLAVSFAPTLAPDARILDVLVDGEAVPYDSSPERSGIRVVVAATLEDATVISIVYRTPDDRP